MEKCPICKTETNVSLNENSTPEQYTCNTCEFTWDRKCMLDNVNSEEEHLQYLIDSGYVKKLQHHYDTTVGLWATDKPIKDLLHLFFNHKSDASNLEASEQEKMEKEFSKFIETISFQITGA